MAVHKPGAPKKAWNQLNRIPVNNKHRVLLVCLNGVESLEYFINSQFLILWWLLRLNKVFLVNTEDSDWVEYVLIVNIRSTGG